jgi:hypothetical protein
MTKTSITKAALLGSASALGVNWIYDQVLLDKRAKQQSLIFNPIDHDFYKQAKNAYDVYPNHQVGQLDFMGEVLYLFYMFKQYEEDQSIARWNEYFFEYFKPGNGYNGYIEKYGKDFLSRYQEALDENQIFPNETDHLDKQLIGLTFILHTYGDKNSIDKVNDALHFARTMTSYVNITPLTILLFELLKKLDYGVEKTKAMEEVIELAPEIYENRLRAALTIPDQQEFVQNYAGIACGIEQALPLIFYFIKNTNSWEEAMELNAKMGGASSARGIFISALLSRIYDIPEKYESLLYYKL